MQNALQMYWDCDVPNVVAGDVVRYVEGGMEAPPTFTKERNLSDRFLFLVDTLQWIMENHTEPDMGVDEDGNIKTNKLENILRPEVLKKLLKYDNPDKECSGFNVVSSAILEYPASQKFPGLQKYLLEFLLNFCRSELDVENMTMISCEMTLCVIRQINLLHGNITVQDESKSEYMQEKLNVIGAGAARDELLWKVVLYAKDER